MFFFKALNDLKVLKLLSDNSGHSSWTDNFQLSIFNFSAPTFCMLIIMCIFARLTNAKGREY